MTRMYYATVSALLAVAAFFPTVVRAKPTYDPMRLFEGRTELVSTMNVFIKKPYQTRSIGHGKIRADGSLHLVQRVEEQGKPSHERRWHIRQVAPGRFSGTMSDAKGPVTIDEIGGRYRFRFKMKGHLAVEQWLTPLANGKAARSNLTIRKFGAVVARSDGMVRKMD